MQKSVKMRTAFISPELILSGLKLKGKNHLAVVYFHEQIKINDQGD